MCETSKGAARVLVSNTYIRFPSMNEQAGNEPVYPASAPIDGALSPTQAPSSLFLNPEDDEGHHNMVVIGVLLGIIVVLSCLFLALTLPPLIRCLRRRTPVPQKTIDSRYDTIEGWLITKRARGHSSLCHGAGCLGQNVTGEQDEEETSDERSKIKLVTSYDTAETSDDSLLGSTACQECPICMEEFAVGDIVSWSPNLDGICNHVFHHHCIKVREYGDCRNPTQ